MTQGFHSRIRKGTPHCTMQSVKRETTCCRCCWSLVQMSPLPTIMGSMPCITPPCEETPGMWLCSAPTNCLGGTRARFKWTLWISSFSVCVLNAFSKTLIRCGTAEHSYAFMDSEGQGKCTSVSTLMHNFS